MLHTRNGHTQHQTYNMAFSFGFSGDDIEEDPNDVSPQTQEQSAPDADVPPPVAAQAHNLDDLVCRCLRYSSIIVKVFVQPSL